MTEDVFAAAAGPKRSAEHTKMVRRNRRLLAERLGWPAGALGECYRVEAEFPGWAVHWSSSHRGEAGGPVFPDGYHAIFEGRRRVERRREFGETPDELAAAVRASRPSPADTW